MEIMNRAKGQRNAESVLGKWLNRLSKSGVHCAYCNKERSYYDDPIYKRKVLLVCDCELQLDNLQKAHAGILKTHDGINKQKDGPNDRQKYYMEESQVILQRIEDTMYDVKNPVKDYSKEKPHLGVEDGVAEF